MASCDLLQFGMFETMISGFVDSFPQLNQHKVLFTGLLCVAEFFVGLPLVTRVCT